MESNMINKLLGAAAMAAVILAVAPASAAKMMGGCSGDNMMKTENMVEAMADGPSKDIGRKEITDAQTAMLDGKMGACGMHINKAMHVSTMK
jgi:hypothetical protein